MLTVIEELQPIIELFEADNDNLQYWLNQSRFFIQSENGDSDFMLRFNSHTRSLVVARIAFSNQRKGNGRKLLELLEEYGRKRSFDHIVFENIISESGYRFMKKYGFERDVNNAVERHPYFGNWLRRIKESDIV